MIMNYFFTTVICQSRMCADEVWTHGVSIIATANYGRQLSALCGLHKGHFASDKCRARVRNAADTEIENLVQCCSICIDNKTNRKVPLQQLGINLTVVVRAQGKTMNLVWRCGSQSALMRLRARPKLRMPVQARLSVEPGVFVSFAFLWSGRKGNPFRDGVRVVRLLEAYFRASTSAGNNINYASLVLPFPASLSNATEPKVPVPNYHF